MNKNDREQLLTILENELGEYTVHGNSNEVSFYCPFCHHYKKKLAINLEKRAWQCWVCESTGKSLYSLLSSVDADSSAFIQLKNITGKEEYTKEDKESETYFSLPDEFIPITKASKSYELKNAVKYLKKRGLTREDIIKYNIGYCEEGLYENYVIVPSYDENNKLNYFVARNYYDKGGIKYRNPSRSKNQFMFGNTISFKLPVVLVEGVFDAIAVKRNAIPLLGKKIQPVLYDKMMKYDVEDVYIMLDLDAREEALNIAEKLMNQHINTYVVEMGEEDPADLGFYKANQKIKETEQTDFSELVKLQFQ